LVFLLDNDPDISLAGFIFRWAKSPVRHAIVAGNGEANKSPVSFEIFLAVLAVIAVLTRFVALAVVAAAVIAIFLAALAVIVVVIALAALAVIVIAIALAALAVIVIVLGIFVGLVALAVIAIALAALAVIVIVLGIFVGLVALAVIAAVIARLGALATRGRAIVIAVLAVFGFVALDLLADFQEDMFF
jgi:hypothetical protein